MDACECIQLQHTGHANPQGTNMFFCGWTSCESISFGSCADGFLMRNKSTEWTNPRACSEISSLAGLNCTFVLRFPKVHHISFLVSLILILAKDHLCCQVTLHRMLYDHPALWSSLFNQLQFCLGFRRHLGGATYRSQHQNSSLVEIQSHLRLQRPKKDKKHCKEQRCKNGMYIKCFPIKDPKIAFNFRVSVWHWGRTGYSLQQPVQSLTKLDLLSPVSKSFNPISNSCRVDYS